MAAIDPWNKSPNMSTFGRRGAEVEPSDTADLTNVAKAITVLTAGTLAFIPADNANDEIITYDEVTVGFIPPYLVRRVMETGTTATVATVEG